jgi:hypothetical protein
MNRQIKECRFNVVLFNGTTNTVVSGFPTNVNVTDGVYAYTPYYHTGSPYDEALSGKLRSQLGGYRFEATLSWDRLINSTPVLNLLNNAYTNTNAEVRIFFHPDSTNSVVREEVVIQDVSWASSVDKTIVRQPITVTLAGKYVSNTISSYYQI